MTQTGPGFNPRIGFSAVDAQPDPKVLLAGMEATAEWPAVRRLRAWERERLALRPGDRLLDVGCGLGDVATTLASEVSPGGRVVAVDASQEMLGEARRRAADAGVDVAFREGDAGNLDEPDGSFDACRSERTLQWVTDAGSAVAEMVRVLRPGGRLCLTDTDFRTFVIDLPDVRLAVEMNQTFLEVRGPGSTVGGRLVNLCRDAGLADLDMTAETHLCTEWDPDASPAPPGFPPLEGIVGRLVASGDVDEDTARRFLEQLFDAGRRGRFFMALTMFAVAGRRPPNG